MNSNPPARSSVRPPIAAVVGLLLLSVARAATTVSSSPAPYEAVNPFIGTAGGGNTFPAATLPYGMIQWGPDTRSDGWYYYEDHTTRGFSLTHLSGAGCPQYADVPILPWLGPVTAGDSPQSSTLAFSHAREHAHPGLYAVQFDNGIRTALTVTTRAGIGRFQFPDHAERSFLIKAASSATHLKPLPWAKDATVEIRGHDTVVGSVRNGCFCSGRSNRYVLYFVLKFSRPFVASGTWKDGVHPGANTVSGKKTGAYVTFPAGSGPILVKVGLSFVSIDNAAANLAAEIPGWDFSSVRAAARRQWNKALALVTADGGTPAQRTIFYTGLYHMMLSPNVFTDDNGDYIGFDQKVRRLGAHDGQFANFSDWDIYRDVIQLDALLHPGKTSQMMDSLVRDAEQSGWLPRWPVANDVSYVMGGDSPPILLSTAYAFGARNFDTRAALHYMLKAANETGVGPHDQSERVSQPDYLRLGYVPVGGWNETGASVTLEYTNSDFAISRFAASMGDDAEAARLLERAQNWRHVFDPESGFIRPRDQDGKFVAGWDPDHLLPHHKHQPWDAGDQYGFEEGSTWQYTWMIPFDYAGLFRAMGGPSRVVPKLDKTFRALVGWEVPHFTVTNEPDFCAPYAYVWAGYPWKTQQVIDRIRRETFAAKPDGLPGNDDLGATSGVYVWNALGMYPVIPGVGGLVLGTPMFPRAVLRLGHGRTLEIIGHGHGIYVQSVTLNGQPRSGAWLPLSALAAGANRLVFELGPQPNPAWGRAPADYPPSFEPPGADGPTRPATSP